MHNNNKGIWERKAPLKTPISHPAVAVYKEKIYLFGGGGQKFSSLDSTLIYDTRYDVWTAGKTMPSHRSGAAAVTINDKIYVIGGGLRKEDGLFKFLQTVEIYDPELDSWKIGPELLMPHDYPGIAVLDNLIYIIGGHHPDAAKYGPKTDPGLSFCERLDIRKRTWEAISPLPTPRFALSSVAVKGTIFAIGGVAYTKEGFNNFDIIEIYDPSLNKWIREEDISLPWPAAGFGGCVMDDKIYICGGYSGDTIHDRTACYDTKKDCWKKLPSMPIPKAAMGIGSAGKTIYLIGGWAKDGKTPTHSVYGLNLLTISNFR